MDPMTSPEFQAHATAAPRRRDGGEQSRSMYPDEEGYIERDGVASSTRSTAAATPTILFCRPGPRSLAGLEDADPVFRPPLPGDRLRPARQWQERPAARGRGLRRGRVRQGRPGRPERDGHGDGVRRRPLGRPAGPPAGGGASRSGRRAWFFIGRSPCQPVGGRAALAAHDGIHGLQPLFFAMPLVTRGRRSSTPSTPPQLPRIRGVVRRAGRGEPHSTKEFEDAVSWAHETDPETLIRR